MRFEPLTADLYKRFHGKIQAFSMRGFAWMEGDEVVGVISVHFDGNRWCLHCDLSEGLRARLETMAVKRWAVRAIRRTISLIERVPGKVHVAAQDDIPKAAGMLEHMGFKRLEDNVWEWA